MKLKDTLEVNFYDVLFGVEGIVYIYLHTQLKIGSLIYCTTESSSVIEHHLAKVRVAGLNPVFRSESFIGCPGGGIGRHVGLKIQ